MELNANADCSMEVALADAINSVAGFRPPPSQGPAPRASQGGEECAICMDTVPSGVSQACRNPSCGGFMHDECQADYFHNVVEGSRYQCASMRCAACAERLPREFWGPEARQADKTKYDQNARTVLWDGYHGSHLGGACSPQTFAQIKGPVDKVKEVFGERATDVLVAIAAYHRGQIDVDYFIEVLDRFAPVADIQRVFGNNTNKLTSMQYFFPDMERRACFQIHWYYKHPMDASGWCFKCKARHRDQTCAEFNNAQYGNVNIKYCPRCGVATQKSFNCDHMICICGHQYHWNTLSAWSSS